MADQAGCLRQPRVRHSLTDTRCVIPSVGLEMSNNCFEIVGDGHFDGTTLDETLKGRKGEMKMILPEIF